MINGELTISDDLLLVLAPAHHLEAVPTERHPDPGHRVEQVLQGNPCLKVLIQGSVLSIVA